MQFQRSVSKPGTARNIGRVLKKIAAVCAVRQADGRELDTDKVIQMCYCYNIDASWLVSVCVEIAKTKEEKQ